MVFQDPVTSMNPHMSAAEIIEEPLLVQLSWTASRARPLIDLVSWNPVECRRRILPCDSAQAELVADAATLGFLLPTASFDFSHQAPTTASPSLET